MAIIFEFPTHKTRDLVDLEDELKKHFQEYPSEVKASIIEAVLAVYRKFYIPKEEVRINIQGEYSEEQVKQMTDAFSGGLGELWIQHQLVVFELAKVTARLTANRAGFDPTW